MAESKSDQAFQYALKSNSAWAQQTSTQKSDYFHNLASGQAPKILWIGCADSRCPETTILGLQPGDVFVHRNIANVVSATDINTSAVLEYGVGHLKVECIVVAGHTCCGGVAGALADSQVGGVLDAWLAPIKAVRRRHADELAAISDAKARATRLAELNVRAGVDVVLNNHVVASAIRDRGLCVRGVVFDLDTGIVKDLNVGTGCDTSSSSSVVSGLSNAASRLSNVKVL